jgi:hypothetical protein
MKPIRIKINLSKLDKTAFFESRSGDKWLDLVAWPTKESRFGETHSLKQSYPAGDERAKGSPFVGSLTLPDAQPSSQAATLPSNQPIPFNQQPTEADDIPF